jgi:protein-glutamine gamma-glutamyltransferase
LLADTFLTTSSQTTVSQSPAPRGVIPLSEAIDKYFELSLYLLVLMGFGTLASTGALDLPAIVLVGAALAVRGYFFSQSRRMAISERFTTPLTILYFVFYATDYLVLSRNFLTATVHLVLFAVVVRAFSLRRERDYTTMAILAFLMVLASAVLTVDSVFLFFFSAFTLMAVITFILLEMRRSANAAKFRARHSSDMQEHRHLAFSLARLAPALVLMMLLGAAVVFFLLPRTSTGYLGAYAAGTDFSTGFSGRVQLGGIGQIQQSNAVVMHIRIDGDQHGRYALHWRGVGLANFDGMNWYNPRGLYVLAPDLDGGFTVPRFTQGIMSGANEHNVAPGHVIHYHVVMEPIGTNVFFLAPWPRRVKGAYRALQFDNNGSLSNLDSQHAVSVYEADSDTSTPSPAQLRDAGDSLPAFTSTYLQLPPLDPRIPRLAEEITRSASNNYDKATAVELYLKTHYGYTLQLPRSPVADPLANFLFDRRQGHCEYFASSMAVLLRTLHIPSRVVNGFRSNEFNDVTGNYVLRAKDAHAWVEVYFPNYGWITFDPTPGGGIASPQGWGRIGLYLDAASSFWREWVVSYDASHQYTLGRSVLSGTRRSRDRAHFWAQLNYARLLNSARRLERKVTLAPKPWTAWILASAVFLLLAPNGPRIARILRNRRLQTHPERSPGQAAAMWYERMSKVLSRRGQRKSAAQTPQEFVRVIADGRLRSRVANFTDAYESARFGQSSEDAQRLPELYAEVKLAAKK